MKVWFKSDYNHAAGFNLLFLSTPVFRIKECTNTWKDFDKSLPDSSVNDKYWRITLTRTTGRIIKHRMLKLDLSLGNQQKNYQLELGMSNKRA